MHYQIFLPHTTDAGAGDKLAAVGLADHVDGAEFVLCGSGPENQPGVLCAWRKPGDGADLCYHAERQTWLPAALEGELERGRYWVGFDNAKPPRPEDLVRRYPYAGPVMELGGMSWRIPEPRELPHDMILADDGTLKFEVQRKFYDHCLAAGDWAELVQIAYDDPEAGLDYADMWRFVVRALRINYRLTPEVVSHLRLLDQHNVMRAMVAAAGLIVKHAGG